MEKANEYKNSKEDRDEALKRRVDALLENGTTNREGAEAMLKTRLGLSEKDLDDLTTKDKEYEALHKQGNIKNEYTRQELIDKYGTDDVDLINAGKAAEDRVTKKPEYVYDKGDYSSLAIKDKKYEILEESSSAFGTELYKLKDEEGNILYKPKSEVYNKEEKEANDNLTLMNRYSGTIQLLQEEHPNWSMAKIMEKIRKLEEED